MIYAFSIIGIVTGIAYGFSIIAIGIFLNYSWQKLFGSITLPDSLAVYHPQDICITDDNGVKLSAWFICSPHNTDGKAIILVHGFNVTRMSLVDEALFFIEAGYHVLLYDQRAHGKSSLARFTFGRAEGADFVAVLRYLQQHPAIDPSHIIALGVSSGASAILYAMTHDTVAVSLRALILEAAWSSNSDIPYHFMKQRMRLPYLLNRFLYFCVVMPAAYLIGWGKTPHASPIDVIEHVDGTPILLIWGKYDLVIPHHAMMELYDAIQAPKEVWWISDSEHDQAIKRDPIEFRERVNNFLHRYLIGQSASVG